MQCRRLLCAIGVSLWSVVPAASQGTAPGPLSTELRSRLRDGRFDTVTSIRGLPLGVRQALQDLFATPILDIAEPGDAFQQAGASGDATLPTRRLVAAACTTNHCLVYYERGGAVPGRRVLLFSWTPAATRLELGGVAPVGVATIDDVRKAILAGAIKEQAAW
jgi:hypothetical protein